MDKVTKAWRRLYEGLYDLYSSQNIIWVIKSIRLRWTVHVAHMGDRRGATGFWWENLRDKDYVKTYAYMDDIKTGLEEVEWGAWTGLI